MPDQNRPDQNRPDRNDRPGQNDWPGQNRPDQNRPDRNDRPGQNDWPGQNRPDQNRPDRNDQPDQNDWPGQKDRVDRNEWPGQNDPTAQRDLTDRDNLADQPDLTEPIDPDVDLRVRSHRREFLQDQGPVLAVIALGGGLGALARYGLAAALPTLPGRFPWGTFATNVAGCFLLGVLMVVLTEIRPVHRLARPFLGVGILGGFTTFSTYAVETRGLLAPGSVPLAFGYLGGTLVAALLAVLAGMALTRTVAVRPKRTVEL